MGAGFGFSGHIPPGEDPGRDPDLAGGTKYIPCYPQNMLSLERGCLGFVPASVTSRISGRSSTNAIYKYRHHIASILSILETQIVLIGIMFSLVLSVLTIYFHEGQSVSQRCGNITTGVHYVISQSDVTKFSTLVYLLYCTHHHQRLGQPSNTEPDK